METPGQVQAQRAQIDARLKEARAYVRTDELLQECVPPTLAHARARASHAGQPQLSRNPTTAKPAPFVYRGAQGSGSVSGARGALCV
jgi:hypothetical protein